MSDVYRSIFFSDHCIKQINSTLSWVCSVIDHRGRHLLLNRRTATWNLFVKFHDTSNEIKICINKF